MIVDDVDGALSLLGDRIFKDFPELSTVQPTGCTVGIRVSPMRLNDMPAVPIIAMHPIHKNILSVTGLGSRGLLYHGILGKIAVNAALSGNFNDVPSELLYVQR